MEYVFLVDVRWVHVYQYTNLKRRHVINLVRDGDTRRATHTDTSQEAVAGVQPTLT